MKLPAALLLAIATLHAADAPLSIAVFDFQSPEEGVRDLGPKITSLVTAQLSADARLLTVERAELDKALGEQELALSGSVAPENAARVGQLTGATVLVTGRVMKAEAETLVVAKIIGTETGRVFAVTAKLAPNGSLADTAVSLAGMIGDLATKNAGVLVAKVEPAEARIARIKAALGAAEKRPVVAVKIPEQHFGRPVSDPAAETEIAHILQACGFTIADEKSTTRADFAIEGEAFSERALQRGNLVICKARVEVKLRNLATGALIASDRQVSVATDLGEHIAAKAALALAGAELAERLTGRIR
ncbi:MAG: CsgG/HfaB family protein [Chthoniobacteraceae bacterium]